MSPKILSDTTCYHCGLDTLTPAYQFDDKAFCCAGCQSVYQVLSSNSLCDYYRYNDTPGQTQKGRSKQFAYLDEDSIAEELVDFRNETLTLVSFYIPTIHCSSCIWLLEHLHKLEPGIVHSRIDFLKKQVSITFKHQDVSLREVVELLSSVGYEPLISLQDVVKEKKSSVNRNLIKRIAVAGLCMGNVMLFSFPEYLGLGSFDAQYKNLFGWLNLAFSTPATIYCSREFFVSAWSGLKNRMINLDAPLALIIAVLFIRTVFEILTGTGAGFADTLTGLIFLLLMGRWVKKRAYSHLSFERDYKSYFPIAVAIKKDDKEQFVSVSDLRVGDRIFLRNNEILPADSILLQGEGCFDFSFVTGESEPVLKVLGEIVFAGGRQVGEAIELEVIKPVSESYLTRLWNNENYKDTKLGQNFNDRIAKYFSIVVLLIAFSAAGFWIYQSNSEKAWAAFTAVLIVACPCVLSLSTPFSLSAVLAIFDRHSFFVKNTDAIERLALIDTIVFDKTGTITSSHAACISSTAKLSDTEKSMITSIANQSSHPLSKEIARYLDSKFSIPVNDFKEHPGKGVSGFVNGIFIRLGNQEFINPPIRYTQGASSVFIEIDGAYKGCFHINHTWRTGLNEFLKTLSNRFNIHLLSGDNNNKKGEIEPLFPYESEVLFEQSPYQKLDFVCNLQAGGQKVMMCGDGLNDSGALKQSDFGIAVTEDFNNFSPGCDAVLSGNSLMELHQFISMAKDSMHVIRMSFVIASVYNLIGVYYAVQGSLSPLTAAVLMPLSTITILSFGSVYIRHFMNKNLL